jgi:hypothetical protein
MNQVTTDVTTLNIATTGPMNHLDKGDVVQSMALLPEGFVPSDDDVICGRGRNCFHHTGNVRFRGIVAGYLEQYSKSTSKNEKSNMLSDIVAKVVCKSSPNGGGFVKKCPKTKRFYDVGNFLAREKTSQAFRDALHDQYKSSNSAKKKRRQVMQAVKLQKAYSASNIGYDAAAEPLADYTPSSSKFMRVDRPVDLLQKAYSASNIGYDATAEPLDAYTPSSSKFMRVDRPRSSRFDFQKAYSTSNIGYDATAEPLDMDPLIGSLDISEFGIKPDRRGLLSQNLVLRGSSRSVLEFNRPENKSHEEFDGPLKNCEGESDSKPFLEEYRSSSRIAQNPFLDSKPYFSLSSSSLMSVEESIAEDQEAFGDFEEPMLLLEEKELAMDILLASLMHDVDMGGDPFEPAPLPEM